MIYRRKFIKYALIAAGTGTMIIAAGDNGYKVSYFEKAIIAILTEDLKGLKVTQADLKKYAREFSQKNTLGYSFFTKSLISLHPVNSYLRLPLSLRSRYIQSRAELVGYFLLSTNFFYDKMDEQKDIVYSNYIYEPYKYTCSNPFSGSQYEL